jgi:hypothetical protein
MKPNTIYSKSGKGVQEASGKTSLLKRGDRAVLSAIDGRTTLAEVAQKVGKSFDGPFQQLIAQLDRDGFVREVTAAPSTASQSRPAVAAARPAPAAPKPPPAKAASAEGEDLDFTTIMPVLKRSAAAQPSAPASPAPKPAAAKEQEAALYKARQEAEARAQAERDRLREETEAKARAETEAKIRAETEKKVREEAEGKLKAQADAKARAAREAALRIATEAKAKAEAEAQAKIDAERRAREEVERKAKEEAEKARREAEALRQRLDEERKAREAEERKRKEDEERRRREEEERRAREEAERKAREDAERQRREEEERLRREEEEQRRRQEEERRMREEIDAKAREAAERARREEEDRRLQQKEAQARQARDMEEARSRASRRQHEEDETRLSKPEEETLTRQPALPAAAPDLRPEPAASSGGGSLDALMADLDSFSQCEDEERQAREADDTKLRTEKKRMADEEAARRARERVAQEEQERKRAAEEARRRDEEERRAQEEAERRVREAEEQRRLEAEERKLRVAPAFEDMPVSEADLGMDDVRRDEAAVARETRKAERERERDARQRSLEARQRAEAASREQPIKYAKARRPVKWGRPAAITLFVLLAVAIGVLHIMPLPMADYEDAASKALGRPVKIGSARLWILTGVRLDLRDVTVGGDVRIASVHAYPRIGSLIDQKKAFRRIELDGVRLPQQAIGGAFAARMRVDNFNVGRILARNLKLEGPVPLPALEADALIGPDGALRSVALRGPDSLDAKLTPAPNGEVELDVTAASLAVPFVPELTLTSFAMKGMANRQGANIGSWGGAALDGVLSGTARVRWGGSWHIDGVVTVRGINAAVLAPALLSEGKAEGSGRFSMSGTNPAKLYNGARIEGSFTVGKGALGSFDLSRVLQTSGRQHGGRTPFTELSGQGVYDRGAIALRNISMTAGALHAGASADIAPGGALAGRIVADIRTTVQPLRAVVVVEGTVKEPQVRN